MAAAAREDEQVPYEVAIAQPFGGEKRNADGVRNSPRQEPEQTSQGHTQPQGPDRDQDQPPHAEVDTGGEAWVPDSSRRRQHYPQNCQAPDQPEEGPAPRSTPSVNGVYVPAMRRKTAP